jgi:hypothetical protein
VAVASARWRTPATAVDELGTGGNLSPAHWAPDRRAYRVIAGPPRKAHAFRRLLTGRDSSAGYASLMPHGPVAELQVRIRP